MKLATGFSGIEGFGLAAQRCGMELVAASEVNRFCCKVLANRFPAVPNLGDIREVRGRDIQAAAGGAVDIWAGGWPCQDLSVAGLRAGLAGERSGLFREVVRLLDELAPEWFLLENVPGLFSSYTPITAPPEPVDVLGRPAQAGNWEVDEDSDFEEVLASLTELGYGVAWRCLDARYFDLAQRRERALLVGHRGDVRRAAQVLFEPDSCERHPATRRGARPGVAASLTRGSGRTGSQPGRRREDDENLVAYALRRDPGGIGQGHNTTFIPTASYALASHHARNNREATYIAHPLRAKANSAHRADMQTPAIAWDLAQITSPENRGGVEAGVAPTLARGGKPMLGVRRLMPVECERLQGFPDGWTCLHDHPQQCDCPDGPRYEALGNAVAVNVAEWVLRRMLAVHEGRLEAAA